MIISYTKKKLKILIVENELIIAEDLKEILKEYGYNVCAVVTSANEAVVAIDQYSPDFALLDIKIKGISDGITLAKRIDEQYQIPYVFITANTDYKTILSVKELNSYGYLTKPYIPIDVIRIVYVAMDNYRKDQINCCSE